MDLGAYVLNRLCVEPAYVAACVLRWRGETRRKRRDKNRFTSFDRDIEADQQCCCPGGHRALPSGGRRSAGGPGGCGRGPEGPVVCGLNAAFG